MPNILPRMFRQPITLFKFNLLLAIWLGAVLNLSFFHRLQSLTPYSGIKASFFILSAVVVVVACYWAIFQITNWKWTAKVFAILLIVVGGMSAYFVNTLGIVINADQVQNMMQTDAHEVTDLISIRFILWVLFLVILPVIVVIKLKIKKEPVPTIVFKKATALLTALLLMGASLFIYYVDYASIFRENRELKGLISPQNSIGALWAYYKKKRPKENLPLVKYGEDARLNAKADAPPKLMVLVVGEAARAQSFSLNGYQRQTNPELSKQQLINFTQASSCGTATAVSVPCMFSGMPRVAYDEQLASHKEGLLDIAQRAGYKVTWIDNNSGCKGTCNRVEDIPKTEALQKKWCEDECLDGILIDMFKDYLAHIPQDDKRPQLIVLHQVGSHGPAYYKRAPKEYKRFQPACESNAIQGCSSQELINAYDNTILYTDHILSSVIDILKNTNDYQTGLWYLSDHGESTGESGMYLHGAPYALAPSQQTHIGMFMWFSPKWQANAPQQIKCLEEQRQEQRGQDNFFPSVLSLLDVKTKVIDPQFDMLSHCA